MIRKTLRRLSILGALFMIPAILHAGVNSWTGGNPTPTAEAYSLVAADPADPYAVYGTFAGQLHRSRDGGRTWNLIRTSINIGTFLVHPASPSTIYVAGYDSARAASGVFKSTDAGETWSRVLDAVYINVLAGSPTEASTVFAGANEQIYRTTDGGATWTAAAPISGVIASLVIDRRAPTVAYAGGEGYDYWGITPGSMVKTTDGGMSWLDTAPPSLESTTAVAVDHLANSTVYIAVGPYKWSDSATPANVLRSEDGGASWTSAGEGLPGSIVRCLAADPRVSGTLYAGTDSGVYRSRDFGAKWAPFGQRLAGIQIISLAIDDDGRRLYAGTVGGVYGLEIASGPLDVAAGPGGESRLLVLDSDRAAVGALDASGNWTSGPFEGSSATWVATAIASGGERTHLLWQCGDGRSGLEIVGPAGRQSATVFDANPGWIASDLSVRSDGKTSVLWTGEGGRMRIATVGSSGAATLGPEYGPAIGWSAVAIADDAAGRTWVLWRSTDGRAGLSLHRAGVMLTSFLWAAEPDWTAEDVAVGADGRPRLLRTAADGTAEVSVVDGEGRLTSAVTYGSPGFTPRRIAAGPDGLTRLLFGGDGGTGDVVFLGADNTLSARYAIPASNAATVTVSTAAELEVALAPANAGARILVRAGEYEVTRPLTVPNRAILAGEGVMTLDASHLPAGIAPSGRTLLKASSDLVGDVLTLGDGSVVRGLAIEDAEARQAGNPVAVVSRDGGDSVSARILECEIVNPNPSGVSPAGPTGRGLVVMTRNPNLGQDPPAHEGAVLRVQMTRSIVRSPAAGIGVFAINFASHAEIHLDLESNVIGGGLNSTGGVSRPDAVTAARTIVDTRRNLYRSEGPASTPTGWSLLGGTTAIIPGLASQASTFNALRLHSRDDRIEGFGLGISAVGGARSNALSEPASSNGIDLNLHGTILRTAAVDLALFGASTFVDGVSPGDANTVHVVMHQASGSGARGNAYAHSVGDLGTGNRLEIAGSPSDFARANRNIDPAPPAEFFMARE